MWRPSRQHAFFAALWLVYAAGWAALALAINYFEAPPALYFVALMWPLVFFGLANALIVLVPLSLILMTYRYGHLSYELSLVLAGLFLAAMIAVALRYR